MRRLILPLTAETPGRQTVFSGSPAALCSAGTSQVTLVLSPGDTTLTSVRGYSSLSLVPPVVLALSRLLQAPGNTEQNMIHYLDRVKRIWYLSPMRAAKVQASLRIRAVSPEPSLLAHTSS